MCHYCMIVSGELPASVVYEDECTLAFLVIKPVTPGHVVVIPKKHVESFAELSDVDANDLIHAVKRVDQAIKASDLTCEAVSIYLGDGERAGQEIPHINVHVFPRFSDDQFTINFNTELIRHRSIAALEDDAQKIREGLKRIH